MNTVLLGHFLLRVGIGFLILAVAALLYDLFSGDSE